MDIQKVIEIFDVRVVLIQEISAKSPHNFIKMLKARRCLLYLDSGIFSIYARLLQRNIFLRSTSLSKKKHSRYNPIMYSENNVSSPAAKMRTNECFYGNEQKF
jgi:hypothetical protein